MPRWAEAVNVDEKMRNDVMRWDQQKGDLTSASDMCLSDHRALLRFLAVFVKTENQSRKYSC